MFAKTLEGDLIPKYDFTAFTIREPTLFAHSPAPLTASAIPSFRPRRRFLPAEYSHFRALSNRFLTRVMKPAVRTRKSATRSEKPVHRPRTMFLPAAVSQ